MSLGYRCFVVEGDEVTKITQKNFNAFFFRRQPNLPQYARRTIVVVMIYYVIEHRLPQRIIRTDASRLKVGTDGSLDEAALTEHIGNIFRFSEKDFDVVPLPAPKISSVATSIMRNTIFRGSN